MSPLPTIDRQKLGRMKRMLRAQEGHGIDHLAETLELSTRTVHRYLTIIGAETEGQLVRLGVDRPTRYRIIDA